MVEVGDLIGSIESLNKNIPYKVNMEHARFSLYEGIAKKQMFGFFTENGVILGEFKVCSFNFSMKMAEEIMFRTNGKDGFKLLKSFERHAHNNGATHVVFTTIDGLCKDTKTQTKALKRYGYSKYCNVWGKLLV